MSDRAYRWYKIFNVNEFLALSLPSKKYSVFLDAEGEKEILVTQGMVTSILIDGVFLPLEFAGFNPWGEEARAVYVDENNDCFVGYEVTP